MGIGYQEKLSEDMTNRWWEQVYDKAASNVSSTGKSNEKDQDTIASSFAKLTDEELFKACGGRTAHKAARHGLRLNGKLERIKCQEKKLVDASSNLSGNDNVKNEKRKKKRKKSINEESSAENEDVLIVEDVSNEVPTKKKKICDSTSLCDEKVKKGKTKKQKKCNNEEYIIVIEEDSNEVPTNKKMEHENNICDLTMLSDDDVKIVNSDLNDSRSKKLSKSKKQKNNEQNNLEKLRT